MDLATVDHVLTTTRSVRRRLDLRRPVERQVIEQCSDVALHAPNGGNRGRYHCVVVTEPAKRAGLAEVYRKAPLHVFYHGVRRMDPGFLRLLAIVRSICTRCRSISSPVVVFQMCTLPLYRLG